MALAIGMIVEISTDDGPAEAVITRVWDKPASDPYITVRTTEDQGRTFIRCTSAVRREEQLIREALDRGYFPGMDSPKLREV